MAKPKKRKQARELRQQGWTIKAIADEIGIRADTVSKWCLDIELSDEQIAKIAKSDASWLGKHEVAQKIRQDALDKRKVYQTQGRVRAKSGSELHLMGCMLYWAEGAKARNHLRFVNTDVHMMRLFTKFLRQEFQVADSQIYLNIKHHTIDNAEIDRIRAYWLDALNIDTVCTVKMQFKQGKTSRKTRYENGICTIGVNNTEILHHIYGAIQEYLGFDKPEWLA